MPLVQDGKRGYVVEVKPERAEFRKTRGRVVKKDMGRLRMRLTSKRVFNQYKDHLGLSNADVAFAAKCSEASVAFLASTGKSSRDTIGFEAAQRIEKLFNVPTGLLFAPLIVGASPSVQVPVRPVGQRRVVRVPGKRSLVNA